MTPLEKQRALDGLESAERGLYAALDALEDADAWWAYDVVESAMERLGRLAGDIGGMVVVS